jgi:Ca2+/H+ antiporter, TMEM165/GDT1 family
MKNRFLEGFLKSWGVILASEIGDKTFFIAAVMAMRNSRKQVRSSSQPCHAAIASSPTPYHAISSTQSLFSHFTQVFLGAIGALAAMTVLSALLGWAAPNLISKTYTHYAATALFFVFGIRMLYEAATNAGTGESELSEVERELSTAHKASPPAPGSVVENGGLASGGRRKDRDAATPPPPSSGLDTVVSIVRRLVSPILLEAFTLTFLAEWGDRSQIATIGLAAASDVVGVTLGGIVGHALCTGAAVLGGKHLAAHIDERFVAFFGGVLFLVFGAHSLWSGVPT